MLDADAKFRLLIAAIILMIPITVWYWTNDKQNECEQQGGVLVTVPYGMRCIEAKVLI